jgi:hypothetical protein
MKAYEEMKQRYFDKHGKDADKNKHHFTLWLCSGIRQHEKTITSLSIDNANNQARMHDFLDTLKS